MKVLVLFGSQSDKLIYDELMPLKRDFEVEFKVISAHRNPDELEKKLARTILIS